MKPPQRSAFGPRYVRFVVNPDAPVPVSLDEAIEVKSFQPDPWTTETIQINGVNRYSQVGGAPGEIKR
jgi:hypothetical protein